MAIAPLDLEAVAGDWPRPALFLVDADCGPQAHPPEGVGGVAATGSRPLGLVTDRRSQTRGRVSGRVRRRRWTALAALAALAAVLALSAPVGGMLGRPGDTTASPAPAAGVEAGALPLSVAAGQGVFYVVRPGDTVASIAARVAPGDPQQAMARLVARLGSSTVVPGEHLRFG